jgi:hypothetical protein
MVRKWIIRSLAMSLLTLCVVAWVGSWWKWIGFQYGHGDCALFILKVECGTVEVANRNLTYIAAFEWGLRPAECEAHQNVLQGCRHRVFGFASDTDTGAWHDKEFFMPFWFPTLLSALLLRVLWRKTRPKYSGKSFPVEPAATEIIKP